MLCATSVGGHAVARTVDGLVATALLLRGAQPKFLLCDAALPACELCTICRISEVEEFAVMGRKLACVRTVLDRRRHIRAFADPFTS